MAALAESPALIATIGNCAGVLRSYRDRLAASPSLTVDRPEIVAHATLSALAHHWPSQATEELVELLSATAEIRAHEPSRWLTQRRLALAKLARALSRD